MIVERTRFALWNMKTRVILLKFFKLELASFLFSIDKFVIYTVFILLDLLCNFSGMEIWRPFLLGQVMHICFIVLALLWDYVALIL